ncbi:MAG: hypothetical protein JNK65_08630 [Deltaproteobacteria bacterium]|nr:hypothetical protein [Deltaproteobacteria bacterium]
MAIASGLSTQKKIYGTDFNDLSSARAIMSLNGKESVSAQEMKDTIIKATRDLDNNAAGKEYVDLKKFVTDNRSKLSCEAKQQFSIYEKYVKASHARGQTGIPLNEYRKMIAEMNQALAFKGYTNTQTQTFTHQLNQLQRGAGPITQCGTALPSTSSNSYIPTYSYTPTCRSQSELQGQYGIAANETARVWGDPHFEDADGGKFDVQGEPGKTYNLFNDTGVALNGRFDGAGNGTTVVGETGLTLYGMGGSSQLQFNKAGIATLNGSPLNPGSMETLADGGHAHLSEDGKTLTIKTAEGYTITQKAKGGEMDIRVKSPAHGVAMDGKMPGGLLGQTFDADKMARNSSGKQGEGAIAGVVQNYEVNGGVFGGVPSSIQQGIPQAGFQQLTQLFQNVGLQAPTQLPNYNPVYGNPIDWNQVLNAQSMDFFLKQTDRQQMMNSFQDSQRKTEKLTQLLQMLLQSGNIDLAMLLIAQIETKEAQSMVGTMTQKLQEAQAARRNLSQQMGSVQGQNGQQGGQNPQAQLQNLQVQMQDTNDTIQMLTTMIKDINDQKNRTIEFANNFLGAEHQTTMSIVRGMK